ncbi:MAG: alpha/beta fold hydrolase [Firmicutes bacterium]|nr:alpha/beta fold hydrolase [Bacillota bacterium]
MDNEQQTMMSEEAKELLEKNRKYAEVVLKSYSLSPDDFDRIKTELKLAPTPKEVIHTECSVKLYRYTPKKKKLHSVPLVIVPSLILKYYVMDLITDHSIIEHFVNQGIDVYLVDWGVPGDEHGKLTFDYYIDTFLRRCVRKVMRRTGSKKINLMGQCLGGTIASVYAATYPEQINKLLCLTTPIDFEDAGLLSLWTDSKTFDIDKIVESYGNVIPADFVHACFQYLDVKATVQSYKKLYNNVLDDNFLYYYRALDSWLKDKIPFPAQVFKKFIRELYQENRLAKGKFTVNGKTADLSNITCPVLNVVSQFDHVFPEKSAKALNDLVTGETEYHVIPAGHVTLVTIFPQRFETFRVMTEFILKD